METVNQREQKRLCPFEKSHYILKGRMETHVVKCRRKFLKDNEGKVNYVACDFNSTHKVPEPEIQYHHDNCPDKFKVEVAIIREEQEYALAPEPAPRVVVPTDDSWDDGPAVPSYDPKKYCMENNILRRVDTLSAAVRRDFKISERQRVGEILKKQEQEVVPRRHNRENRRDVENVELPPTPVYKSTHAECTPDDIQRQMQDLTLRAIRPPVGVIPKRK